MRALLRTLILMGSLVCSVGCADISGAADQRAILDLNVNEVGKGQILVFLRGGEVLARVSDLERAGLNSFAGRREFLRGEKYVFLTSLAPAVSFRLDEKALSLHLVAQPSLLGSTLLELRNARPPEIEYSDNTSAFLNYAVNLRDFKRYDVFGEMGVSLRNTLLYSSFSRNVEGSVTRGLTNLTLDNRQRMIRSVLGDHFVDGGSLGGGLFFGGISFSREFKLDPYFIRNPTFGLSGAVLTPSTVDVYINDQLLRREKLPPGQFELRNLPVSTGSGSARLVIRDALGQEREIVSPYYFTAGLLSRGLHEFTYNLGFRRNNVGTESWKYDRLAFLGRHRFGFSDSITAGGRIEASSSLISGGPTLTARLPYGEAELTTDASHENGFAGGASSLGYSYLGKALNLAGSLRLLSPHYATSSLGASETRPWLEFNAVTGIPLTPSSSLTLQYGFANSQDHGQSHRVALLTSIRLTNWISLSISASHSRHEQSSVNEVFSGLTFSFGHATGSLSYQHRDDDSVRTIGLQKSLPVGSGYGYRFQASKTENAERFFGLLQYQGPYGRYEANYDQTNGRDSTVFSIAGGLAAIGGKVFATRPIQQSFGLIRVPGVANVRGYASNQEIGHTNSNGDLLVPNLLPNYGNRLSIAAEDIPLDYNIAATEKTIAPPLQGGALVAFPVQRIRRLIGTVRLEQSGETTFPAYGQLFVAASGKDFESPIGKRGEFYLENVPAGRHAAKIEYNGKVCKFTLKVPASKEQVIKLGNLSCQVN